MEQTVVIVGGGPAGLTACHALARAGARSVVLEQDPQVGGLARTVEHRGFRFDIGGHRFFTKIPEVSALWEEILGEEFLTRGRLSRIYYRNRFFYYPLRPANALANLGPVESARILLSWLWARARPVRPERSFEDWVSNRFGRRLYEIFFRTYTEKVWGIPCAEIGADWAAQRIQNLSLATAVRNALLGARGRKGGDVVTTLIDEFRYPRLGPGQLWERCRELCEAQGAEVRLGWRAVEIRHRDGVVRSVVAQRPDGGREEVEGGSFLLSLPLRELVPALRPEPPEEAREAASRLRHRDFLSIALVVDRAELFLDSWINVHSPEVRLGRIQNYKNWSPDMVPDPRKTGIGLEYSSGKGTTSGRGPTGS